jgi:hypothetical protein
MGGGLMGLRLNDPTGNLDGFRCKPVGGITGRLEQLGECVLVLAWPETPPPIMCRLVYVPAVWIVGDDPMEDDGK